MSDTEMTSMESKQLQSSQKEAMKKITEFSGESNGLDIDEWLSDLTNLYTVMQLNDQTKILETMGKLTGPALRWYQGNLRSFLSWDETEKALRNRFKEFTSTSQLLQDLFNTHQQENESVISFYENVIRRYRRAEQHVTERQVITVLQTGVKSSLKEQLIRREDEINKPEQWLQFAREEEYIQKRIQQQCQQVLVEPSRVPFFEPMLPTATIQPKPSMNKNHGQYSKPQLEQKSFTNHRSFPRQGKNQANKACLICQRRNHSTNNCFYKKETGCYKCGQTTHRIRDCPQQQHFFE